MKRVRQNLTQESAMMFKWGIIGAETSMAGAQLNLIGLLFVFLTRGVHSIKEFLNPGTSHR